MSATGSVRLIPILVAFGAAFVIATLGGLATRLTPWYYALRMPSWKPPDWLFGPAWTLIYTLSALAAAYAWCAAADDALRARVVILFVVNSIFGVGWSVLFFTLRRPDWSLVEVVPFWLSILALIIVLAPSRNAIGWLLSPYLVWVTFASFLNLAVVRLNAPFAAGTW